MDYQAIFDRANAAAVVAVARENEAHGDMGACGFAWAKIDGNDGLARWCRKQIRLAVANRDAIEAIPLTRAQIENGVSRDYLASRRAEMQYGSKGHPGGWEFWSPGDYAGQSVAVKEAGAYAFAAVLSAYDIRCAPGSRLD